MKTGAKAAGNEANEAQPLALMLGRGLGDDFTPEVAVALTAARNAADKELGAASIVPGQRHLGTVAATTGN